MDSLPQLLHEPWMHTLIGVCVLSLVAWLAGVVAHFLVFRVVRRMVKHTTWHWDDELFRFGVFRWLARMVPTVVVQFGIALVPEVPDKAEHLVNNIALGVDGVLRGDGDQRGVVGDGVALPGHPGRRAAPDQGPDAAGQAGAVHRRRRW